jgi:hypothetical protein
MLLTGKTQVDTGKTGHLLVISCNCRGFLREETLKENLKFIFCPIFTYASQIFINCAKTHLKKTPDILKQNLETNLQY